MLGNASWTFADFYGNAEFITFNPKLYKFYF